MVNPSPALRPTELLVGSNEEAAKALLYARQGDLLRTTLMQSPECGVNQIFSFMGDEGCRSNKLDIFAPSIG